MKNLLDFANKQYNSIQDCPIQNSSINCYDCISSHFYSSDGNEKYDCIKGLSDYIMEYGPCYASSTYHFLQASDILSRYPSNSCIKILSIGCGFSPDYYAFKKFIADKNLALFIDYYGIELHEDWGLFHNSHKSDKTINFQDVLSTRILNFETYDIIIMDKFFSTLSNPDGRSRWLELLKCYVKKMKSDAILIFKDVNHQDRGRDFFDSEISPLFNKSTHYKYNVAGAYGQHYQNINKTSNVFTDFPSDLSIIPKNEVMKEIVFVYENKKQEID